jgi:aspartyl protease family protein
MAGDDWVSLVFAGIMLLAVLGGASTRGMGVRRTLSMIASWLPIFGGVYLAFVYRDELRGIGQRVLSDVRSDAAHVVGKDVQIVQAADGHFWLRASIDGVPTRFLIDSGATVTALSERTVAEARLQRDRGGGGLVTTANGTIRVDRVTIGRLEAATIVRHDLTAMTSPAFGDMNVLGMNFLSSLRGWSVRGRTLTMTP